MKYLVLFTVLILIFSSYPVVTAQDAGPYHKEIRLGRGMVRSAAWSPDGTLLAVGGALGIWLYTPDFEDVGLLTGHTKAVYGLAFSPDGTRLASASHDSTVRIWDVAAQKELLKLEGHTGLVVTVAWSPDGTTLASGGYDGTVRLWNPETGALLLTLDGQTPWVQMVYWSDKQLISLGRDGTITIWQMDGWPDTPPQITRVLNSAHRLPLMVMEIPYGDDPLRVLWRNRDQSVEEQWVMSDGTTYPAVSSWITAHAAAREPLFGAKFALVDWDSTVEIVNAFTDGPVRMQPEHTDWITALAWSEDGRQLTAASLDGKLRVWDATTGAFVAISDGDLEPNPARAICPDGTRHTEIDINGLVRVVDSASNTVIAEFPGRVNAAAWSPDGSRLAVALRNGAIDIWGE